MPLEFWRITIPHTCQLWHLKPFFRKQKYCYFHFQCTNCQIDLYQVGKCVCRKHTYLSRFFLFAAPVKRIWLKCCFNLPHTGRDREGHERWRHPQPPWHRQVGRERWAPSQMQAALCQDTLVQCNVQSGKKISVTINKFCIFNCIINSLWSIAKYSMQCEEPWRI